MPRVKTVIGIALLIGAGVRLAAQQPASTASRANPNPTTVARPLSPVRPTVAGNLSPVIRGNAVTASNAAMANTMVRLRDARFGRIIDAQTTDDLGAFTFTTVDPGSYVVEVLGNDQTVIAASDIINVNAGDLVNALIKMPFRVPPLAGILGGSSSSAALVTAQAVASGVLATAVVGSAVSETRPF